MRGMRSYAVMTDFLLIAADLLCVAFMVFACGFVVGRFSRWS